MTAVPLCQTDALAGTFSEVVQLCSAGFAAAKRYNVNDVWRIEREYTLDAFVTSNASYGKCLVHSSAAACYHGSGECLDTRLDAFCDSALNIDNIADLKLRNLFFEAFTFYRIH